METLWENFIAAILGCATEFYPQGPFPLYQEGTFRLSLWIIELKCWREEVEDAGKLLKRRDFQHMVASQFDRRLRCLSLAKNARRRMRGGGGGGGADKEDGERWIDLVAPVGIAVEYDTTRLEFLVFPSVEERGKPDAKQHDLVTWPLEPMSPRVRVVLKRLVMAGNIQTGSKEEKGELEM